MMKSLRSLTTGCFAALLFMAPGFVDAQVKFFGVGDLPGGIVQSEVRDTTRVGSVLYAVGEAPPEARPCEPELALL